MDIVRSILEWFNAATPNPTPANATTQLGCHIEECIETFTALNAGLDLSQLKELADQLKAMDNDQSIAFLSGVNHIELNDGLCDTVVTAIGTSRYIGYRTYKSLINVVCSNWSKFENDKPIRDENGKIKKGRFYFKPDLAHFSTPKVIERVVGTNNEQL